MQKIVTDVIEFKCTGEEKLCLSPLVDLYNREIIGMGMSKRPTLDFVRDSLYQALPVIGDRAAYWTTIYSDQGWHYQHRIFQSMCRQCGHEELLWFA
ncbi:DDE-type integrase/transposase/recombinase [Planococcus kocurii]|uniref:DDE-type integrase/transposase/recombinase n=1 Tax=Planococcus kocurii TaxID=1374 RepID=UPI003D025CA0